MDYTLITVKTLKFIAFDDVDFSPDLLEPNLSEESRFES